MFASLRPRGWGNRRSVSGARHAARSRCCHQNPARGVRAVTRCTTYKITATTAAEELAEFEPSDPYAAGIRKLQEPITIERAGAAGDTDYGAWNAISSSSYARRVTRTALRVRWRRRRCDHDGVPAAFALASRFAGDSRRSKMSFRPSFGNTGSIPNGHCTLYRARNAGSRAAAGGVAKNSLAA